MNSILLAIIFMISSVSFIIALDIQSKRNRKVEDEKDILILELDVYYSNLKKLLSELEEEAIKKGEIEVYEEKYIVQKRRVKMYEKKYGIKI